MEKRRMPARGPAGKSTWGLFIGAVLFSSGCGDDTTNGRPPADAGSHSMDTGAWVDAPGDVAPAADASDAAQLDDETLSDATALDSPGDAAVDGSGGEASDGGACITGIASLAGGASSAEGGALVADEADATSDASSAGGSDGAPGDADSTDAEGGGDAGAESTDAGTAVGAAPPTLLFGFDDGANGWSTGPVDRGTVALGPTSADGHTCPGALMLAASFTAYGPTPTATYGYRSAADWTGFSRLHLWIKVLASDYAPLAAIQPFVESDNFADTYYLYDYVDIMATLADGGNFADGHWHELVVNLGSRADAGMNYDPTTVNAFGVQLNTQDAPGIGAPAAPPPVTMMVDDIWLE